MIAVIIFFAALVQGAVGFGVALVSMPLLVEMVGIRAATPLVALVGIATETIILARYRHAFNLQAVLRLSGASLAAIPLGVFILRRTDERLITMILGFVIIFYAVYALFSPRLPQLTSRMWAYGFGFAAGLLSGAYNAPGPPVIIYGNVRQWQPAEFKSNLQAFFLLNSVAVLIIHAISGNFTSVVWRSFGIGLPAVFLGLWVGFRLERWLNPVLFRRIVQLSLIVLGGRLLIAG